MDTLFTNIDGIIKLDSTSYNTADATPILLNETDTIRTSFIPTVVDNHNDPKCCVNGKLVHERKSKKDEIFPAEKISKKDVKIGDIMKIFLSTSETKALFDGLKDLYDLHSVIGFVPSGVNKYSRIDKSLLDLIRQFGDIGENFTEDDISECISMLTKVLTSKSNTETLSESFKPYANSSEITDFTNIVNISRLKLCVEFFNTNKLNDNEEEWQVFLQENQWLISQLFSYPTTIYDKKAYVGGKKINNDGGKVVDYLYRNNLTGNIALIEIKTPLSPLLGREYRTDIYAPSNELSGGINQLLRYKDSLTKEWNSIGARGTINFNPECLLIIGKTDELDNDDKIASFELFRSNLAHIKVITFDEIKAKIENLIKCLNEE